MIPSIYQADIFDAVENTNDSLLIEAVAGSGKTTTIVKAVKLLPRRIRAIFVAFNKAIAEELGARLPEHIESSTLHSVGLRAWKSYAGNVKIDAKKVYSIMDQDFICKELMTSEFTGMVRYKIKTLVGLMKNHGMVPGTVRDPGIVGLQPCEDEDIRALMSHYDIDFNLSKEGLTRYEYNQMVKEFDAKLFRIVRRILEVNIKSRNMVDFDDMLYFPVIFASQIKYPKYHVVMVDEAQDVSAIQRVILKNILRDGGRLIAVGDSAQAIYGFRGADSKSMSSIAEDFGTRELPLSICYRCPKSVIEVAQQYVPQIEAHEDAPDGEVVDMGTYQRGTMEGFERGDYVICRNVAPLVKCAFALIAARKPCAIKGKDIGSNIKSLIKSLKPSCIPELRQRLRDWEQKEKQKLLDDDPQANLSRIEDRADSVRTFIDCSGAATVDAVCQAVDDMFSDKIEGAIMLSTIHKAKGLEADRVLFLDRNLIPSKYATQEWQKQQETNLLYVAVTRAKQYLGYVYTPDDKQKVEL